MNYTLAKPCHNCPFLRVGGIRLTPERVREIGGGMLDRSGGEFPCHVTTTHADYEDEDGEDCFVETGDELHCAGALIFAEKNGTATQMMRISERLHMYDARKLMSDKAAVDSVFNSLREMLDVNKRDQKRPAKKRKRKEPQS